MNSAEQKAMETRLEKVKVVEKHLDELKLALDYIENRPCTITLSVDRFVGGRRAVPKLFLPANDPDYVPDLPTIGTKEDVVYLLKNRIAILELYYSQL